MTKRQPRGADYVVKTVNKKEYLSDILGRLNNDVGPLIDCIEALNKTSEHKVGFFSMVRVMMPMIEVVATSEGRAPQDLMKDLGMALPYTQWNLYRDIFAHNDEFVYAGVDKLGLQVGIFFTSSDEEDIAEFLAKDGRNIDPAWLHRRMVEYLEKKISNINDEETVDVIGELIYDPNSSEPEIQAAVKEIRDFHAQTTSGSKDEEE